jgi:hypothetical protein
MMRSVIGAKSAETGEVMHSLLKDLLISAAIIVLVVYRNDIGSMLSGLWGDVSPSSVPRPLEQSVQRAGAAVNGVMDGVGHVIGR